MPIFDQGYQHWSGHLSSQTWRWLAIARQGVRVGFKSLWLRRMIFTAILPALGLSAFLAVWGLIEQRSSIVSRIVPILKFLNAEILADPRRYRVEVWTLSYTYFLEAELWISMILVLFVGPSLISQDLRFNALPLYFSRPLRRIDYFAGKLGVIVAFLGMVIVIPAIVAYILGLLFSLDVTIIPETLPILLGALLYGVVISVSAGTIMLALSALTRNSRYVMILWLVFWFMTSVVSTILVTIDREQLARSVMMEQQSFQFQTAANREKQFERQEQRIVEADRNDWRPLISYMEDLRQVGHKLLGTNAAWESLRRLQPPEARLGFRMVFMNAQYAWYWSAAVLACLFGISAWILNRRVRSLDRLK